MKDEGILDLLSDSNPFHGLIAFIEAGIEKQLDAFDVCIRPNHAVAMATDPVERQKEIEAGAFDSHDFAASMNDDTMDDARVAFMESVADFYPTRASAAKVVLDKARQELARQRSPETVAKMAGVAEKALNERFSSLPDGSESTPTNSVSEN